MRTTFEGAGMGQSRRVSRTETADNVGGSGLKTQRNSPETKTSSVEKGSGLFALRRKWKSLRAKKLWVYEQYSPRPLRAPKRYSTTKASRADLAFAIVTPAFGHRQFLAATIASVQDQNYPRVRYTVQDGGSTDGSGDLLRDFGDRLDWRSEPDDGQADAINRGFERISGDIMAWLNSRATKSG